MALAGGAFVLVVGFRPGTELTAEIGPEMNSSTEGLLAGAVEPGLANLSALIADRGGARVALQALGGIEAGSIITEFAQESRSELLAQAGQGAEKVVIRMLLEAFGDLAAVLVQMILQHPQLAGQGPSQKALGVGDRRAAAELLRGGKERQPFGVEFLGVPELVGV